MANWRFYGRERETAELRSFMFPESENGRKSKTPMCWLVAGRRGAGKTSLFHHAVSGNPWAKPVIHHEMNPAETPRQAAAALMDSVSDAGCGGLLSELPSSEEMPDTPRPFKEVLCALFKGNAVVALDEFHHALKSRTAGSVKLAIDEWRLLRGRESSARLLLMGSHQQRVREMVKSDGVLHGRVRRVLHLPEWDLDAVLAMASEQGLLRHPGKFMTLWTAYGGLPKHWEDLNNESEGQRSANLDAFKDDGEWRRRFVEDERERLSDPTERFDDKAWITLKPEWRDVILELGNNVNKGLSARDLARRIEGRKLEGNEDRKAAERMQKCLEDMRNELQAVEPRGRFGVDPHEARWTISDANMLFQLHVFPELFGLGRTVTGEMQCEWFDERSQEERLERLATLEGKGLERLAAGWVLAQSRRHRTSDKAWARTCVWMKAGRPDADAVGITGPAESPRLTLVFCKRNPGSHDPARNEKIAKGILGYMERIDPEMRFRLGWGIPPRQEGETAEGRKAVADRWQNDPDNVRLVAVSPDFPEQERERFRNRTTAWEAADVASIACDMARHRGRGETGEHRLSEATFGGPSSGMDSGQPGPSEHP